MDTLQAFFEDLKHLGVAEGHLLGLLHILIGRNIRKADGTLVSEGMTWRELAPILKRVRWPKEAVTELGLEPDDLSPRDREKFWYTAIAKAGVDSPEAKTDGDTLAELLAEEGYDVGPAPGEGKTDSNPT